MYTEPVTKLAGLFRQRYRWKLGSLQALFHHRQMFFTRRPSQTKLLGWVRLPLAVWGEFMLLIEPLMLTYFLYLAVHFHVPLLIALNWLIFTLTLFYIVWTDDFLPLHERLRLTVFVPVIFSIFYIMTFVQVAAMIKCLIHWRQVTGTSASGVAWRSPERLARTATVA